MNEYEYLQRQITILEKKLNQQTLIEKPDRMNAWTPIFKTAAYVNATSFTIAGIDLTAYLTIGVKVKLTNATVKYGYVSSSSYSAGTGLTTVNLVANTSYALAGGEISDVYISFANPPDFPGAFGYTPTAVGLTSPVYGSRMGKFLIRGKFCLFAYQMGISSWSGQSGYISIHPPIVPVGTIVVSGIGSYYRSGGSVYDGAVRLDIYNNEIVLGYNTDASENVSWEASSFVNLQGQIDYQVG